MAQHPKSVKLKVRAGKSFEALEPYAPKEGEVQRRVIKKPGDVVELSPAQAAAFKDVFEEGKHDDDEDETVDEVQEPSNSTAKETKVAASEAAPQAPASPTAAAAQAKTDAEHAAAEAKKAEADKNAAAKK